MGVVVHGSVAPGFEAVGRVFEENFSKRAEVGAAFAVYKDGELVVDLWGGEADVATHRPWVQDTTAVMFSATKGLVSVAWLMLEDRGLLDLDRPVAFYWPEFGRHGKADVTVRMLLNHRAGLCAVDERLTLADFADPRRVEGALVRQVPLWTPGHGQGYGATAWGMYAGALFRRVTGETVGQWLRREVFDPLGADVFLGLPAAENARVATLYPIGTSTILGTILPQILRGLTLEGRVYKRMLLDRGSETHRAFFNPSLGRARLNALNRPDVRALELPWMNAIGTARGVARVYAALAGAAEGPALVRPDAVARIAPKQSWSNADLVIGKPLGFSQGFQKEEPHLVSPNEVSFGHLGAGGAVGWADPSRRLAFAYLMNRMDYRLRSKRATALCRSVYASTDGWT